MSDNKANTTTDTAVEIAASLSAGERKCLAFNNLNSLSTSMFTQLFYKGLIYKRIEGDKLLYERTELGNAVLAVLAALPATESRLTEITASQWHLVAEAVKTGKCIVICHGTNEVTNIQLSGDTGTLYYKWFGEFETRHEFESVRASDKFDVEWVKDPATEPAQTEIDAEFMTYSEFVDAETEVFNTLEQRKRQARAQDASATEPAQAGGDTREDALTEKDLRSMWLRHRLEARQNGEDGIEFIEYLIKRLNLYRDKANEFAGYLNKSETELAAAEARAQTAERERDAAVKAWDVSEEQWVHLSRMLEMPYEETDSWEMVARVADIIANKITLETRLREAEDRAWKAEAVMRRGGLVEWAIEASRVWIEFVKSDDESEEPLEAMKVTMNVLTSTVKDYQRTTAKPESEG